MRRIAVDPTDPFRISVVPNDISPNLPSEVRDRCKDAARQQVPFGLGKPELPLIKPGIQEHLIGARIVKDLCFARVHLPEISSPQTL
jgi:hypothetical protein